MTIGTNLEPDAYNYKTKIDTISSQFLSVLDDFKKYYVFTNKNPEVEEYQHFFLEKQTQIEKINKEVFSIKNNIENNINELNKTISKLNEELSSEKELEKEMNKMIKHLKENGNGSKIMLSETNVIYNHQYLLNIELLFGIIMMLYLSFKIFKKKV